MSKQKIGEFVVMVWKKIFKRKLSMIAWFGLGYLHMMGEMEKGGSILIIFIPLKAMIH